MIKHTLIFGFLFFAFHAAAVAQDSSSPSDSECLQNLVALRQQHHSTRAHLTEADRRELKVLSQAVRISVRNEESFVCVAIVDLVGNILEDRRERLVEKGIVLELERELRLQQLAEAKDLNSVRTTLRSSDLVGAELRNANDQELGEIEDVLVDADSGKVEHVLVSTGGLWGIGEDLAAIPIHLLRATQGLDTVVLDVSPEALSEAPKLDAEHLGLASDDGWKDTNTRFFEERIGLEE